MATRDGPVRDNGQNDDQFDWNNGGGLFFGEPNDEPVGPGSILAAFESPAEGDEGEDAEPIQFECIDLEWTRRNNGPIATRFARSTLDGEDGPPLFVLELEKVPKWVRRGAPGSVTWYRVQYEPISPRYADGRIYRNLFSDGTPIRISTADQIDDLVDKRSVEDLEFLAALVNEAAAYPDAFQACMSRFASSAGVAVYDVGQGAWQGLISKDAQEPFAYVDCGGGVFYNRKTFPKRFHRPDDVPHIILSHWDWDHWSSAHRFSGLLKAHWFAPPVPVKPIQLKVALQVLMSGILTVMDLPAAATTSSGCVTLERCTGKTDNDSGLAVTVRSRMAGNARRCLLPGDAAYRYIPSVANKPSQAFHALAMSHHGGRLHSNDYPIPSARKPVAANSAGPGNTYKHPLFQTLIAHVAGGWPLPIQTGTSGSRPCHVFMPWGKPAMLYHGPTQLTGPSIAL